MFDRFSGFHGKQAGQREKPHREGGAEHLSSCVEDVRQGAREEITGRPTAERGR